MTKNKIRWIIGIMGIALIGIIYLQVYSIRLGIKLNTEQFDKSVFSVLANVSSRLEKNETNDAIVAINGYSAEEIEKETDDNFSLIELMRTVSNSEQLKNDKFGALDALTRGMDTLPVEQRIPVTKLESFFRKEMKNHGISLDYSYGVFSNQKNEFVIYNGHYLVNGGGHQPVQKRFADLKKTPYNAFLFAQDKQSPGQLMVFFPQKRNFIRSTLMPYVLAVVLFTGIVMLIFFYTIFIILRQKKVSEMKSDFMNNMTHEFKTPIATISLAADSITNPSIINNPEKVKRFADIIRQENKRMHKQVEQVLNSARWERKEVQLKLESVDIHVVIREAVNNLRLQVEQKGGKIDMQLDSPNSILELDKTHISNIIHNLLDNANKYSIEKPKISVLTRNENGTFQVLIKDNGIGIGKEARKHIFEKFYRVHTGDRHDVKGFGLGLSYVKTLVELQGGQITVESELGKGSQFVLSFPTTKK